MNYEQDYIMRMIKEAAVALARVIFHKKGAMYELPAKGQLTDVDDLYIRLIEMADGGFINEAENLLYSKLDDGDRTYLEMGIGFYYHLNEYKEDFLRANQYSREEISDGLVQLLKEYNLESLTEFLNM